MADQKRWWKLWHSALSDDDIIARPPALRWAWAALGAHTKIHGTNGKVEISMTNTVLAAQIGVPITDLLGTVKMLPKMHIEEVITDNGKFTVTWENWLQYQEDSTVAERVKRLRSKRRGEEKRGEEKRITPSDPGGSVGDLIGLFHIKQTEVLGEKPSSFNGGALAKFLKAAVAVHPIEEIKKRIGFWFQSTEPFIITNGFSTTLFTSKFSLLKGGPIHANQSSSPGSYQGVKAAPGKYDSLPVR